AAASRRTPWPTPSRSAWPGSGSPRRTTLLRWREGKRRERSAAAPDPPLGPVAHPAAAAPSGSRGHRSRRPPPDRLGGLEGPGPPSPGDRGLDVPSGSDGGGAGGAGGAAGPGKGGLDPGPRREPAILPARLPDPLSRSARSVF